MRLRGKGQAGDTTPGGGVGGAASTNGNGKLPSLSEGKIDFVMRSFEATMALPAEEPVDVAEAVVRKAKKAGN